MTVIRLAALADVPELRRLIESAYRGDSARGGWTHEADLLEDDRTGEAELAATIANPAARLLVAQAEGRMTGTVTITQLDAARSYLGMLCVDPRLQTAGLGRQLLAAAETLAVRDFASNTMEMTVIDRRAELIAWYERRGYRRTGEVRPFPAPGHFPFAMVVLKRGIS
jgi:ribosomal protein S18 acetylase RimI-like enzyme